MSCYPSASAQQLPYTLQVGGELARSIADFEQQSQMTLMHRFNKAADLLDQVLQVRIASPSTFQHPMLSARYNRWLLSWARLALQGCNVQVLA